MAVAESEIYRVHETVPSDFYVTGGTVPPDAASYVTRQADHELLSRRCSGGEYCFVLNTRQMGKSSLMRPHYRPFYSVQQGVSCAVFLDLTRFGGQNRHVGTMVSTAFWRKRAGQLGLYDELDDFWLDLREGNYARFFPAALRFFGKLR